MLILLIDKEDQIEAKMKSTVQEKLDGDTRIRKIWYPTGGVLVNRCSAELKTRYE